MNERGLPSTLDLALTRMNPGRRRFLGKMLSGAAALALLTSAALAAGQTAAEPSFSPKPGTYSTAQRVTITSNNGEGAVYYTTDGSSPCNGIGNPTGNSTQYHGPITISKTTMINAVLIFGKTCTPSAAVEATYTITAQ